MTEYVTIEKTEYENLLKRIKELEDILWVYQHPSIPPSKRIFKEEENRQDGKTEEKKRGAPEGHTGATRERSKITRRIDLKPYTCATCGSIQINILNHEKRTIEDVEIVKVTTQFTQYRYYCKCCSADFITTHPDLPKEGVFGPNICKIWSLLHYKGIIPFERLSELSGNIFDVGITQKGVMDAIYRTTKALEPTYQEIKSEISTSKYVRSDETSYPFNRQKWWLWNLSNYTATLVVIRFSRGSDVLESVLKPINGRIINSDCHSSYDKFIADYQKCWSHVLGFSKKAAEIDKYAEKIDEMLHKMFEYIKFVKENGLEGRKVVMKEIKTMKGLIERLRKNKRRSNITNRLVKRLQKYNDDWFKCLIYNYVEPTNNSSEHDIRINVLARKISGLHRSERGIHAREIMMSTLLTTRRQEIDFPRFIGGKIREYNNLVVRS